MAKPSSIQELIEQRIPPKGPPKEAPKEEVGPPIASSGFKEPVPKKEPENDGKMRRLPKFPVKTKSFLGIGKPKLYRDAEIREPLLLLMLGNNEIATYDNAIGDTIDIKRHNSDKTTELWLEPSKMYRLPCKNGDIRLYLANELEKCVYPTPVRVDSMRLSKMLDFMQMNYKDYETGEQAKLTWAKGGKYLLIFFGAAVFFVLAGPQATAFIQGVIKSLFPPKPTPPSEPAIFESIKMFLFIPSYKVWKWFHGR